MLVEDLSTTLVRAAVVAKAHSALGAHYLRATSGQVPAPTGSPLVLLPNESPKHMFTCEKKGGRRCSGKHGHPDVKALAVGSAGNPAHLANPSGYKWDREVTYDYVNQFKGASCVGEMHFDCIGFIRWCLRGINTTERVAADQSITGFKRLCVPVSRTAALLQDLCMGDLLFRRNFNHIGLAVGASSGRVIEAQREDVGVVAGPVGEWEWHGRLPREFWLGREVPKAG